MIDQPPETQETGDGRLLMDAILNTVADQVVDLDAARANPVLPSVLSREIPDLYVNENGVAMLIYRQPLSSEVWWVEYDSELRRLQFVSLTGQIFDFGIAIHDNVDLFLRGAGVIYLLRIDANGKIIQNDERKLVVHLPGHVNV